MSQKEIATLPTWTKFLWNMDYIDHPIPRFVEVDLTNYCNLNCSWCVSSEVKKFPKVNMSFQLWSKILCQAQEHSQGIVITGGGEPTLHPQIQEIVAELLFALKKKMIPGAGIVTNGTNLEIINYICTSIKDPPFWIRISQNDRPISPELIALIQKHPHRIGLSLIYNTIQELAGCNKNNEIAKSLPLKFIRFKQSHDYNQSILTAEKCVGRLFCAIVEADGSQPYCCLSRGLKGKPPVVCPKGCPWGFDLQEAYKWNPNT